MTLREIKKYQKNTELLIEKIFFQRLIREIVLKMQTDLQFQNLIFRVIQEATKAFFIMFFEDTYNYHFRLSR